jgi:preprotein translocase subunit SecA
MRLFQSEKIAALMDKMGHKEGEVIQAGMVTKSIERAQKKVEENNFGIRKRLLDYDDVMNIQREAIYKKRDHALHGDRLSVDLNNMFEGLAEAILADNLHAGNYETFRNDCLTMMSLDPSITEDEYNTQIEDALLDKLIEEVNAAYKYKGEQINRTLLPVIKQVEENEGHRYKRIAVPFHDGRSKPLSISANLKEAIASEGKTIMEDIEKAVTLALIDENWKEHLRSMDELKDSVQSASFEQKDPLVIYKMEAYKLFEQLIYKINRDVVSYLMNSRIHISGQNGELQEAKEQKTDLSKIRMSRSEQAMKQAAANAGRERQKVETFVRTEKKVGRNEPCPCGSGKKFKQCHGK